MGKNIKELNVWNPPQMALISVAELSGHAKGYLERQQRMARQDDRLVILADQHRIIEEGRKR